jgi:two-component system sensor histidine kinase TctE
MPSLRGRLLAWVMLPLAGALLIEGAVSLRNSQAAAAAVQDRLLLGSARIVAEQLRFEDGAVQALIPPAALELFQSGAADSVYYRVLVDKDHTLTGYPELVLPDAHLQPETPEFFDASVRGQPVRAVAYLQPVLTETGLQPVRVEIAQTLTGRAAMARGLWGHALSQQLGTLALVALLVWVGLRSCLRPLLALHDAVLARRPGSLRPLELGAVPAELSPLVGAINEYALRLEQHTSMQEAFIQNAAHQLRTPLTLLTTQVSYASRTGDPGQRDESLAAIRRTVQQASRLVQQLLSLSNAQVHGTSAPDSGETGDLDGVVRGVLEDMAGRAQRKNIDLGFEGTEPACVVRGHAIALREIVVNLVDNAIRYTPRDGVVTTRIARGAGRVCLTIEDNGPGIPPEEREKVFQRFYRVHDRDSDGSGLGLAIVREFAQSIGATVALATAASGHGLSVEVAFRAA